MEPLILTLTRQLRAARAFEPAARALVDALMALFEPAAEPGRLLRGLVHLRPGGGYRGLVIVDRAGADGVDALLPSATAWRWAAELDAPLEIDVLAGRLRPLGGEPIPLWSAAGDDGRHSQQRLLHRAASHLLVLPLRAAGGAVVGTAALEARDLAAGDDSPWRGLVARAQLLADVAAPWLAALPPQADAAPDLETGDPLLPVVGAAMRGLVGLLQVFAQQDETLLISGPTGSGKSRLARWCHARSGRAGEFVALELQSVPEDMQAPMLFGWRRGAFTGAVRDREGLVAHARGGTLFIDEIDKLSMKAQAGLLQLLEEGAYRVFGGGGRLLQADARFIVGTNADLKALIRAGEFREDLYYRINVLPVRLPGLAERADEIPAWAAHMLARRHRKSRRPGAAALSAGAALALQARAWPGNLRELDNVIRRVHTIALAESLTAGEDIEEGATEGLTITDRHLARALALEDESPARQVAAALEAAARSYAAAAVRAREAGGEILTLERLAAMEGLALASAESLTGDRAEAFLAFGRDRMVAGRNHQRIWRREAAKARELYAALGLDPPPELDA